MMEFVSWDDDIPNIWKNKIHVPNHQSVTHIPQHMVKKNQENGGKMWEPWKGNGGDFC
jgi:hypothetical protein